MNLQQLLLLKVPLRSWRNIKRGPGISGIIFPHQNLILGEYLLFKLETNDFTPWIFNQDILVIDTLQDYQQGMWVLLKQGRNYSIGRVGKSWSKIF